MTVRTQRRLLWLAIALTLTASAWVGWRTFTVEPNIRHDDSMTPSTLITEPASLTHRPPLTLDQMQPHWSRQFRRPLYEPPPQKEEKPKFVPPPLKVKLLGTIMEPGNAQAILMTSNGEVVMPRVGDLVEGAAIEAIDSSAITVSYHNQTIELKVAEE